MLSKGQIELFQKHANDIDTGIDNPELSRALIVYNLTASPVFGRVVFAVDMPWRGCEIPPIRVTKYSNAEDAFGAITNLTYTPPAVSNSKGRLLFDLHFDVVTLPPFSYDTYIAEFVNESCPTNANEQTLIDLSKYVVLETTRHEGSLPSKGAFMFARISS